VELVAELAGSCHQPGQFGGRDVGIECAHRFRKSDND
jgi:hypothetical protein